MTIATRYRQKLGTALLEAGPDAPTLCGTFTAAELAAHLWIRENRVLAAGGIFLPALSRRYQAEADRVMARGFDKVVRDFMAGPPRFGLLSGWRQTYFSAAEFLVHYADVVRATDPHAPLGLVPDEEAELYKILSIASRMILAPSTVPVGLAVEGFPRIQAKDRRGVSSRGDDVVTVCGPVGEVCLWCYQRPHARVEVRGDVNQVVRRAL